MSAGPGGSVAFHFVSRNAEDGTVIGMDVAVDSLATAFLRHVSQERLYRYALGALVRAIHARPGCTVADLLSDCAESTRARLPHARLAGEARLSASWAVGVYLKR